MSHCKNTRCESIYNLFANLGRHQQKACAYWTAWSCKVAELPRAGDQLSNSHVNCSRFILHLLQIVTSPGCPSSQKRLAAYDLDVCICISNLLMIPCWVAQTKIAIYKQSKKCYCVYKINKKLLEMCSALSCYYYYKLCLWIFAECWFKERPDIMVCKPNRSQ